MRHCGGCSPALVAARRGAALRATLSGFSLSWLLSLQVTGSRAHGLQQLRLPAPEHWPNRCSARAWLLHSLWDLPRAGIKLRSSGISRWILDHWAPREALEHFQDNTRPTVPGRLPGHSRTLKHRSIGPQPSSPLCLISSCLMALSTVSVPMTPAFLYPSSTSPLNWKPCYLIAHLTAPVSYWLSTPTGFVPQSLLLW